MRVIQAHKFYFMKGGAERYLLDLSAWLQTQGNEVIPFAMEHPNNLETRYRLFFPSFVSTEKVQLNWSGLKTFGRLFYSVEARRKMAALIEAERPDVAHVHSLYSQLSPSPLDALAAANVPTVMTVHDHHLVSPQYNIWATGCGPDYSRAGVIEATLSKFHKNSYLASFAQAASFSFHYNRGSYRNRVDLFLTPSDYMRRKLVAGGFPEDRIRVNHYGADPELFRPRFDHDGYVVYGGRLSEEKGVEMVIEVAKQLPDIQFKIVGTGPEEGRLHALAHGNDNIEFVGFRSGDALQEMYRNALAMMIPSRVHENFPLSALESLALGTPVVGSHVGGMPEVVEDHVTGLLVQPTDVRGWVEAVMRLAYDEDFRLKLARAARLSVETTFHIKHHYARVTKAYEDAIAMKR